jgi:hypothetical protein
MPSNVTAGAISLYRAADGLVLNAPDFGQFYVRGHSIEVFQYDFCDDCSFEHFLLNHVLPLLLAHNHMFVLHAASVRLGARSVGFVGDSGVGKSTLAASFLASGAELLGDDGLLVRRELERHEAIATYRSLRLREESFSYFSQLTDSPIFQDASSSKCEGTERLADCANVYWPLSAIFLLNPPQEGLGTLSIKRLKPREATMRLLKSVFQLDVSDANTALRAFSHSARLAEDVPCFDLSYPRDFQCLEQLMSAIKSVSAACSNH